LALVLPSSRRALAQPIVRRAVLIAEETEDSALLRAII